MTSNNTENQNN